MKHGIILHVATLNVHPQLLAAKCYHQHICSNTLILGICTDLSTLVLRNKQNTVTLKCKESLPVCSLQKVILRAKLKNQLKQCNAFKYRLSANKTQHSSSTYSCSVCTQMLKMTIPILNSIICSF